MINLLLNFLFPPKCIFCNTFVNDYNYKVCEECEDKLPYNASKRCRVCDVPIDQAYGEFLCARCRKTKRPFLAACAPFVYKGEVRGAILKYKFYGRKSFAKTFSSFMYESILSRNFEADVVTFVPLHFLRQGQRGFNQSRLLAEHLSERLKLPLANSLKKIKNTKPMSKEKFRQRAQMARGAYQIRRGAEDEIRGKRVLIIDDVLTTGETISECARVLRKAGAKCVFAAAIAVTPKDGGIIS